MHILIFNIILIQKKTENMSIYFIMQITINFHLIVFIARKNMLILFYLKTLSILFSLRHDQKIIFLAYVFLRKYFLDFRY